MADAVTKRTQQFQNATITVGELRTLLDGADDGNDVDIHVSPRTGYQLDAGGELTITVTL